MKRFLAAAALAIGLASCEEAESPLSVGNKIFTVQIASDFLDNQVSGYLMLHDSEGNPMGYKPISNGAQVQFEVDQDMKYHLSILRKHPVRDYQLFYARTIANINTDLNFTIGLKELGRSSPFDPNGEFEITVAHQQNLNSTIISNSSGHLSGIAIFGGLQSIAKMNISPHSQNYLASTRSKSDEIRYSFISQPQNGQKIGLSFSEMKPFDSVLKIPQSQIEKLTASVKVLNKENGQWKDSYMLNSTMYENNSPSGDYQIGYLNQFENYETAVIATVSNKISAGFYKIGKAPTSIQLPINKNILPKHSSITRFEFTSDMTFNHWFGEWRLRDQQGTPIAIWNVIGEDSGFKLKSLPADFTAKYPQFADLDLMELSNIRLVHSERSYENIIKEMYVELNNIAETQHYHLMKFFDN